MQKPLRPRAVLVAVKLPGVSDAEHASSLDELARLVSTLGYDVEARLVQARPKLAPGAVIGEGKLRELGELTGGSGRVGTTAPKPKDKARQRREAEAEAERDSQENNGESEGESEPNSGESEPHSGEGNSQENSDESEDDHDRDNDDDDRDNDDDDRDNDDDGDEDKTKSSEAPKVDLVAVDHDISPSQARNLERAVGVTVLDRTGVIVEIFHRHAKSREARLQVEIARLRYTAPRVRESPKGKERQRGRGAGEAALELDRRKIRDRIAELTDELEVIGREQDTRRQHRKGSLRIALVGYTNAGKSSLMRALTGSEVLVEDKLFATLDTTIRTLKPETKPRILVSDTVGFIKKLPHDLVASFKSTLDEALEASHLLHVIDASDDVWEPQCEVTREVLAEIGANTVPTTLVFNKADRLDETAKKALAGRFPDAWIVSAHDPKDVALMHARVLGLFESSYLEASLHVPWAKQSLVAEIHEAGRVIEEEYDENGVVIRFRAPKEAVERIRNALTSR